MITRPRAPKYLTLADAAEEFGVDKRTIRRRIAEGVLPAYRMAGSRLIRIKADEAEACLLEQIPTAERAS